MKSKAAITFVAIVYKVSTLADGGIRVTLDLPENAIADAAALMEAKRQETSLKVEVSMNDKEKRTGQLG